MIGMINNRSKITRIDTTVVVTAINAVTNGLPTHIGYSTTKLEDENISGKLLFTSKNSN